MIRISNALTGESQQNTIEQKTKLLIKKRNPENPSTDMVPYFYYYLYESMINALQFPKYEWKWSFVFHYSPTWIMIAMIVPFSQFDNQMNICALFKNHGRPPRDIYESIIFRISMGKFFIAYIKMLLLFF